MLGGQYEGTEGTCFLNQTLLERSQGGTSTQRCEFNTCEDIWLRATLYWPSQLINLLFRMTQYCIDRANIFILQWIFSGLCLSDQYDCQHRTPDKTSKS